MAKELDAARKEFAAKMKQFAEVTEGLEKRASDASKGEKKKGAAEMADLVRKHNAKYNDMLQQRMQEEDAARAQLEKEHKAEISELKSNLGPQVRLHSCMHRPHDPTCRSIVSSPHPSLQLLASNLPSTSSTLLTLPSTSPRPSLLLPRSSTRRAGLRPSSSGNSAPPTPPSPPSPNLRRRR